jgi:hypothetical protein
MQKKIYGKAMTTGWIFLLMGILGAVTGINVGGSSGNTAFFALAMFSVLFAILGTIILFVYGAMQRRFYEALRDAAPLLRYTINANDYSEYAIKQADEIRFANKASLIIVIICCGIIGIAGFFRGGERAIYFPIIAIILSLLLSFSAWVITNYRINKLKKADQEVILTTESAYVGGQFHVWNVPSIYLSEALYFGAGQYEGSRLPLIKIVYKALTRTGFTPQAVLVPVPEGMREKANIAVSALQGKIKARA